MNAERSANNTIDKARELQRALYRAAKRNQARRFHALFDKVHRGDILLKAWERVKANGGAPGIDGVSVADIEKTGIGQFLSLIQRELQEGTYRPIPVRRVYIPKPDGRQRPLGVPAIRDRVVQMAAKIVIEPIFEADFRDVSYGFRPQRSAHQAVDAIRENMWRSHWAVDIDIVGFFDNIDHDILMLRVERRISDRRILKLIRQWLRAGVMEEGKVRETALGTPQGGVISPLLANIYLDYLDQMWEEHGSHLGTLIRYADDAVALCPTRQMAERALKGFERVLGRLKLQLHPEKTKVVCLWNGEEGFDFLGFHHRKEESRQRKGCYVPKRWLSRKAERSIRQQVREVTDRWSPRAPLEAVIVDLNMKIVGWATYYGHGTAAWRFSKLDRFIWERLLRWHNRKHGLKPSRVAGNTPSWLKKQGLKFLGTTVTKRRQAKAAGEGHRRAV